MVSLALPFPQVSHVVLDLGPSDAMQLPLQLVLVVVNIFNVSDDGIRGTGKLLMMPAQENLLNFELIPLFHDIKAGVVLGHEEILDCEEDDDEKEKDFSLVLRIHVSRVYHVG